MDYNQTNFESARRRLQEKILRLPHHSFSALALEVFRFQAQYNPLYKEFLELLGIEPSTIQKVESIPHLPIALFKQHRIQTGSWTPVKEFTSSGTTGDQTSRHLLRSIEWYHQIARLGFKYFYGPIQEYCVLGLLPAYLERQNSSLVFMVDDFIQQSKYEKSGFFLYNHQELTAQIEACQEQNTPVLLIGVSFALWDLAEQFQINGEQLIIMETGGMKGRRKEIRREELHAIYLDSFAVESIHSEYGMTELVSQAYSKGEGLFFPSPSMQVSGRAITDPFEKSKLGKTAALNIIDLGNLDSISFIATDDLGKVYEDGSFEVLGRLDHSDLRGCNLMIDKY